MFGQTIGKLERPLEHVMFETMNDAQHMFYATICIESLQATIPIITAINDQLQLNKKTGPLYVDGYIPSTTPMQALTFQTPFDKYIEHVSKLGPKQITGQVYNFVRADFATPTHPKNKIHPFQCVASTKSKSNEIQYVLATNEVIEDLFSVSYLKGEFHPLLKKLGMQAVMGFSFKGEKQVGRQFKKELQQIVEQHKEYSGILTLNHVAFVKEIHSEIHHLRTKENS